MLATYGDRRPEDVADGIDSLELAWLLHQLEQHYGAVLELSDEELAGMSTVDGAVGVLAGLTVATGAR